MTVQIAYLADERAGAPTGVRIVEPPPDTHQAQRGNFYALVDLQTAGEQATVLAERILSAMQRTYYTAKGTQSQVLTETMRSAQQLLQNEGGADWRAGVLCIGMMSDRLALAGLGDAFAFVTTDDGDVNVYPAERLSPSFGLDGPLALWPLHRQKIEHGGAVVAGGAEWLEQLSPRMLAGAAAYVTPDNCQDAADGLREQAGLTDIPGMLLVFSWDEPASGAGAGGGSGPPGPPGPTRSTGSAGPGTATGGGSAAQSKPPNAAPPSMPSASTPRSAGSTLPAALNASPPLVDVPVVDVPVVDVPVVDAPVMDTQGTRVSAPAAAVVAEGAVRVWEGWDDPQPAARAQPPPTGTAAASTGAGVPASAAAMPAALAAGAKAGLARARGMFAAVLPERGTGSAPNPLAPPAFNSDEGRGQPSAAAVQSPVRTFTPPPAATGSRARLFIAIAVILLLLIPAIVAGIYWQQGASNRGEAESLLDLAEARLLSAEDALDQEDTTTARALLTEANEYVLQGEEILGRTPRSSDLLERIRSEQQTVMQITPLYGLTTPLATFAADATPQRVLVIDQDVYVLDTGRNEVLLYRLDANGETLAGEGQAVLRAGDVVNGVTVGSLVDVAWQVPVPGYEDKASLLLLDANNRVFRYNQVDGGTLVSFDEPSPWQRATQVEVFSDRLYVADEAANQIYRYAPGTYQEPPTPWFQPTTQVRLQGIEAMRIDGDIWLLFGDGKVVRYHAGEQVPFSLDDSIALAADPVDLYVSQAVNDPTLYLADAAEERVLFFNKETGDFLGQFQAAEGRPLAGLRSIFIDEARSSLFLLTDEALYVQRLPR